MKSYPGLQSLVRAGAGLLLLAAALTAWGINITLDDGTNSVTCPTSATATIAANGDINAFVNSGAACDLSGGGTAGGGTTGGDTGGTTGGDTGGTTGGDTGGTTGGDCGALSPDVTIVDTGTFDGDWPQQTVFPAPKDIAAYKIVVPAGVSAVNTFSTARTSAGLRAKLLVVSTCPGVLQPVGGQSRCTAPNPQETSSVVLTTIENRYRCNLSPGTYYVNAVSKSSLDDPKYSCSSTTNCSNYVSRKRN